MDTSEKSSVPSTLETMAQQQFAPSRALVTTGAEQTLDHSRGVETARGSDGSFITPKAGTVTVEALTRVAPAKNWQLAQASPTHASEALPQHSETDQFIVSETLRATQQSNIPTSVLPSADQPQKNDPILRTQEPAPSKTHDQTSGPPVTPKIKMLPSVANKDTNTLHNLGAETPQQFLLQGDVQEILSWDAPRTSVSTNTGTLPPRSDFAPHVARQLVDVMAQATQRPVEITLSPHELGRVRMSVHSDDGVITVNIIAERADTLDLMRRHIDQLGQSFRAMGYESISFAFGQGNDTAERKNPNSGNTPKNASRTSEVTASSTDQADPNIIQLSHASTAGVDIRL